LATGGVASGQLQKWLKARLMTRANCGNRRVFSVFFYQFFQGVSQWADISHIAKTSKEAANQMEAGSSLRRNKFEDDGVQLSGGGFPLFLDGQTNKPTKNHKKKIVAKK